MLAGFCMTPVFGPHNIISLGELVATGTVLVLAITAMLWMAYKTSGQHLPH
jgi:hypothetical protein